MKCQGHEVSTVSALKLLTIERNINFDLVELTCQRTDLVRYNAVDSNDRKFVSQKMLTN